jgi:hypothetical protein
VVFTAHADMNRIIGMLKAAGLCSDVLYKELYIPQEEIDGKYTKYDTAQPGLCTAIQVRAVPHSIVLMSVQCILADLNSEQKALLDFLVLAKGKYFVGFGSSTFSFYLREHRVLQVPTFLMCFNGYALQLPG